MHTIYLPSGPPGVGKSTLARLAVENGVVPAEGVLSSDAFRIMLTGDIRNQKANHRVFDILYAVLEERTHRHLDSWVDATNMQALDAVDDLAKKHKAKIVAITWPFDRELVVKQNNNRRDGREAVPDKAMEYFFRAWEDLCLPWLLPQAAEDGRLEEITIRDFYQVLDSVDTLC